MPVPPSQFTADEAWERYRTAIVRRIEDPGPEADNAVAQLRDEFLAAIGEPSAASNADNFPSSTVLNFPQRRPRRRAA